MIKNPGKFNQEEWDASIEFVDRTNKGASASMAATMYENPDAIKYIRKCMSEEMTIESFLETSGVELTPYEIMDMTLVPIERVREYFGVDIPDKKYNLCILVSGTEQTDIYGNTGNPEFVALAHRARFTDYYKYIGNQNYNADTIREYLKDFLHGS